MLSSTPVQMCSLNVNATNILTDIVKIVSLWHFVMGWTLFCCDACKGKVKNAIFSDTYFFSPRLKSQVFNLQFTSWICNVFLFQKIWRSMQKILLVIDLSIRMGQLNQWLNPCLSRTKWSMSLIEPCNSLNMLLNTLIYNMLFSALQENHSEALTLLHNLLLIEYQGTST